MQAPSDWARLSPMSTRHVSSHEAEQLTITSADGTPIAVQKRGAGPPLVLVHGTTSNHLSFRFVEPLLGKHLTVYALDRRGRGESGDAPEYAIEREFEDLAAVVDSRGKPSNLLGHSYGALVPGAAPLARNIRRLVLYEPFLGLPIVPTRTIERIEEMIQVASATG